MKPTAFLLIDHHKNGQTTDLWLGKRRVLRLTRRQAKIIYGLVTVLRAHRGGRSVLKSEVAENRWTWLRTICGVLVCTRWGSVMVQWRGFGS